MRLFADGEQIGLRNQATAFSGKLAGCKLIIGHRSFRDTPIVVHAVRLSNVARTAEQMNSGGPAADVFTLMLDRFDSPDSVNGNAVTTAQLISGFAGETGGRLKGKWHFVSKPEPGLALFAAKGPK